jgi:thioredoxin-like negative regulator of GroEL
MHKKIIDLNENEIFDVLNDQSAFCVIYVFTPLCGTCKLAERLIQIATLSGQTNNVYKIDANYSPNLIRKFEIESVPCLIVVNNGELINKHYALKSVQDVFEIIRIKSEV